MLDVRSMWQAYISARTDVSGQMSQPSIFAPPLFDALFTCMHLRNVSQSLQAMELK